MNKKLALIIPCYNEEQRLNTDLVISFSKAYNDLMDIWLVNDGSKDNTLSVIQSAAAQSDNIRVLDVQPNGGKAAAIRKAILQITAPSCEYEFVGFIDADFSAPLDEVLNLMDAQQHTNAMIVAGARIKMLGRNIRRSVMRHYFGRVFATFSVTLLDLPNYDTQCGLKIFRSDLAAKLFAEPLFSRWFFDIELFVRAKVLLGNELYEQKIVEVPLNCWMEVGGSKLKITDFLKAPFEVLKIYRKYRSELKRNRK